MSRINAVVGWFGADGTFHAIEIASKTDRHVELRARNQETGRMELIPRWIHDTVKHSGGNSIWPRDPLIKGR